MSSSGDGDKPAQSGLVDMGDIGFYSSNSPDVLVTFTIADLANYPGSFSEIVLNVTWAQLQSAAGGPLETAFIDDAIGAINAYNAAKTSSIAFIWLPAAEDGTRIGVCTPAARQAVGVDASACAA